MVHKITIIGAGPIGSYAAHLLAKEGMEIEVLEEHKKIGSPVQCTGIVTSDITEIIKPKKEFIINSISKARIFSPNRRFTDINLSNPNIVLDRTGFDKHIADLASDSGATITLGKRADPSKINANMLIGADGPLSAVAKSFRMNPTNSQRRFWKGVQTRVKMENNNLVEFYPYIGTYAWIVPEDSSTVRIGVASRKNPSPLLHDFLNNRIGPAHSNKIIDKQAGLIPEYNPKACTEKTSNGKKVYLVGDSAGHVKATTGGGLVPGLKAASALADSILQNKDYEKEWKKDIGKQLWLHLLIRNSLDKFSKKDWNLLIRLFNKKKSRLNSTIGQYDREDPSKFLLKTLISEPRLLYFAKNII